MSRLQVCLLAFVLALASAQEKAPTTVSIYYESLCPDSIRFIKNQFTPTYRILGSENIIVDYLPYGKANHVQNGNGEWSFTCQHGPNECRGNKNQACALNYITDPDMQVEFINCVMSASYPPDAGPNCASQLSIDYTSIQSCSESTEGDLLLVAYGDRTHSLVPTITFVPTIVYDGVFDQGDQNESLVDFMSVVCRHINPRPAECPAF